jgi:hypothetical protein
MTTDKSDAQKSQKDRLIDKKMRDLPAKKDPKGGKKEGGEKSCGGEKGCGSKKG